VYCRGYRRSAALETLGGSGAALGALKKYLYREDGGGERGRIGMKQPCSTLKNRAKLRWDGAALGSKSDAKIPNSYV